MGGKHPYFWETSNEMQHLWTPERSSASICKKTHMVKVNYTSLINPMDIYIYKYIYIWLYIYTYLLGSPPHPGYQSPPGWHYWNPKLTGETIPEDPSCIVYLPIFGWFLWKMMVNIGRYSIHASYLWEYWNQKKELILKVSCWHLWRVYRVYLYKVGPEPIVLKMEWHGANGWKMPKNKWVSLGLFHPELWEPT